MYTKSLRLFIIYQNILCAHAVLDVHCRVYFYIKQSVMFLYIYIHRNVFGLIFYGVLFRFVPQIIVIHTGSYKQRNGTEQACVEEKTETIMVYSIENSHKF